ncbi:hypothetical protein GOFOIKOB_6465 [Methylobacterium tardum]|uniref:Uncharacterized protein n=1 Tax=Methylobacterium tardum TaxID=374432 RepID=A0AA37TUI4_9HYPH|nr:hypothetical protein [Methylobacterium tardum]URD40263.1 hypothetical protein M6G65_33240 [Methylobacterium tardum]GJE53386.1 hypothetical protein GOFOIKOB_6465 [Methylobacterium tardum]GLS74598.1 hypothetical protein GCM10007890_66160 [Methylobacterium tardum]
MRLIGPFPPPKKKGRSWLGEPAPLTPDDRKDSVFQAGMFALIALDLVIRFGADLWHLLQPPG